MERVATAGMMSERREMNDNDYTKFERVYILRRRKREAVHVRYVYFSLFAVMNNMDDETPRLFFLFVVEIGCIKQLDR